MTTIGALACVAVKITDAIQLEITPPAPIGSPIIYLRCKVIRSQLLMQAQLCRTSDVAQYADDPATCG
jgi:hypothetical protein